MAGAGIHHWLAQKSEPKAGECFTCHMLPSSLHPCLSKEGSAVTLAALLWDFSQHAPIPITTAKLALAQSLQILIISQFCHVIHTAGFSSHAPYDSLLLEKVIVADLAGIMLLAACQVSIVRLSTNGIEAEDLLLQPAGPLRLLLLPTCLPYALSW